MHSFTHSIAIKLHPFLSAAVAAPAARCTLSLTHTHSNTIKLHPFLSAAVAAPAARCTPSLTALQQSCTLFYQQQWQHQLQDAPLHSQHCNKAAPLSISSSGSTSCKMHSFTHSIAIKLHPFLLAAVAAPAARCTPSLTHKTLQ